MQARRSPGRSWPNLPTNDGQAVLSRQCAVDKDAEFLYLVSDMVSAGETRTMTKAPWCPVTATVEVIGGRGKPTILFPLKAQPPRLHEVRRLVPGITQRTLALQLRALEQDVVLSRPVRHT